MNKKIKNILWITMMLSISLVSNAYDFKDGNCYYNITSLLDQTCALTSDIDINSDDWITDLKPCYSGDFTVPQTAQFSDKTFTVTSIDRFAFLDCTLDKLTIPPTIVSATIEGTVGKLIIEDGPEYIQLKVEESAKDIYWGRDMKLDEYNGYAHNCGVSSDVEKIVFGEYITCIPYDFLSGKENLVSVGISDSVKKILTEAFRDCFNLKTISGQNVEHIGAGAFTGCYSLETFDFPNLKVIENNGAFSYCINLKSATLPQGLAEIGTSAFYGCESLESVTIPASVVKIGDDPNNDGFTPASSVFKGCKSLKYITVNNPEPISILGSTFDMQTYLNASLKVPAGAKNKYMEAPVWRNFSTIEEDSDIADNICSVIIGGCDNNVGYVEIGNKKFTEWHGATSAKKGEKITLRFIPVSFESFNHVLGRVWVNDVDMTKSVIDNQLTLEVTGNMNIFVNWKEADEIPIYLSIKHADNGNVKLKVNKWNTYNLIIEPAQGWEIYSVSFNGTDVTDQLSADNSYKTPEITEDSEIAIVYVSEKDAVETMESGLSRLKVFGSAGNIVINNAEDRDSIYVYTTDGALVNTAIAHNGSATISVQENEVYIIRIGNKTFKIGI